MRSWIGDRVALAVVVTIVNVRTHSAAGSAGSRQGDQSPANAIGAPSAGRIRLGCRMDSATRSHS